VSGVADWTGLSLRPGGQRHAPAFLTVVAALLTLTAATIIRECDDLGAELEEAFTEIEDWLVEDSPFEHQP
jgi:hypothetical protein